MKRLYIIIFAIAGIIPAIAQETYENAKIASQDLNGTARYVGMGGAMEALGADISTIPVWLAIGAVIFSVLVGMLSGLYPAIKATKIKAIEAMRSAN